MAGYGKARVSTVLLAASLVSCSGGSEDLLVPVPPTPASFPVWEPDSSSVAGGRDLADLWVRPDGREGWAVGGGGVILHLQSGRWQADSVPSTSPVDWTSVAFNAEGTRGFAVGIGGWIARYEGGRWSARQEAPETQALTSVWIDDAGREAFAVGRGGVALRWTAGRWVRLSLRHDSGRGILLDVVATERELWVRDSVLVAVYSRPDHTWLRDFAGYRASRLWSQPSSPAVWIAGVTNPGRADTRYSVLAVRPERTDTLDRIWELPHVAWMGDTLGCGVAAAWGRKPGRRVYSPFWVYSVGRKLKPFMWPNADSADVRAIWVNADCTAGWAVGRRGYAARLQRRPLRITEMTLEGGPIEELRGQYTLHLASGVPVPTIDSLQLRHRDEVVTLLPRQHFELNATSGLLPAVHLRPEGRAAALEAFRNKEVTLRFILGYPVSKPAYPVVYERDGSFVLEGRSYRKITVWIAVVLLVVAVWALRFRKRSNTLLTATPGQELQQHLPLQWLRAMLDMVMLARMSSVRAKGRVFSRYLAEFQRRYPHDQTEPPLLRVIECPALGTGNGPVPEHVHWRAVFEKLIRKGDRVLWVDDAQGVHGREMLVRWSAISWEHGHIPVLLQLRDTSPIEDQIRRAFDQLGGISGGMPKVWEAGGFVFLLDDTRAEHDESALLSFIRAERGRNFVIVCRRKLTNVGACHLAL
jgi:hypothetical protein